MRDFEAGLSGAQAHAVAGQVKMVIDEVRRIAHHTMGDLTDQAGHHRATFGSAAKVDHAAFGQVPAAQDFAAHQEAARQVFVDTYQGVIQDLEDFRANLLECADAHQANDESVQAGLLALSNRVGSRSLAATRDNRASREEHKQDLARGERQGAAKDVEPGTTPTDTQTTTPSGAPAHADAPSTHSY